MFTELFNFGYVRDWKEALGFYLFYLIMIIGLASVAGGLLAHFGIDVGSGNVGKGVSLMCCTALAVYVQSEREMFGDVKSILYVVLTVFLTLIGATETGLFPVAYLTTRENDEF